MPQLNQHVIATLGDGNTCGNVNSAIRYPRRLQSLLGYQWTSCTFAALGYTASQIQSMWVGDGANIVRGQWPTAPSRRLIVDPGSTDIWINGTLASVAWPTIKSIVDQAVSDGVWNQIFLLTVVPAVSSSVWTSGKQTQHDLFNASVISYTGVGVVSLDISTLLTDVVTTGQLSYLGGTKPDYATPSTSSGTRDFLFYNDVGHAAVANLIYTNVH